jgi:rubrerythrin
MELEMEMNKMKNLNGTQTEKNLLAAFAGESQARNRYSFYASKAKKEGYEQIAAIFQETADNEKEHAEVFFKHLQGRDVEIQASYPASIIGTTEQNLLAAADGEKIEWGTLYPNFAETAEKEGFPMVAHSYKKIAEVEAYHEKRYRKLFENVKNGNVFKKDKPTKWKCRNCGYVFEGLEAPDVCPACQHKQSYYEVWIEPY